MSKEQKEIERLNYIGRLNTHIRSLELEVEEHDINIEFINKVLSVNKKALQSTLQQKELAKEALRITKERLKEEQS